MKTVTESPKNDQPTYAMLADMRDRALLAERERDEARDQRDAITLRLGQTQEHLIDARKSAEHYRNLYYLPKDGLEAAKNHPLPWESPLDSLHNANILPP